MSEGSQVKLWRVKSRRLEVKVKVALVNSQASGVKKSWDKNKGSLIQEEKVEKFSVQESNVKGRQGSEVKEAKESEIYGQRSSMKF